MRRICNAVATICIGSVLVNVLITIIGMWFDKEFLSRTIVLSAMILSFLSARFFWNLNFFTGKRIITSMNAREYILTRDYTVKEEDTNVLNCSVLFGHNQTEGLGELLDSTNYVPQFIRNALSAHHWCLVFRFSIFKTMICELDIDQNGHVKGMYRPYDSKDEIKYTEKLLLVKENFSISPQQIQEAALKNAYNGQIYDVKTASCQHWVMQLATDLNILKDLNAIIENKTNSEHTVVSGLINFSKHKYSKWEIAERGLIHTTKRE